MSVDAERNRALLRYAKLSALAEDQAGTPEGATADRLRAALVERWGFTPLELGASLFDAAGPHGPFSEVMLGGDPLERYREEYRAYLLAALSEVASPRCSVTYNAATWTGRVYAPRQEIADAVTDVYEALQPVLDREFKRWWTPNRFGFRPKAASARSWWINVARSIAQLTTAVSPSPGAGADGYVGYAMLLVLDANAPEPGVDVQASRVGWTVGARIDPALRAKVEALARWRGRA